jgi:hypothetical protein
VAISHQLSALLFTGWLSTDSWTLSLASQLFRSTQLNSWQLTRSSTDPAYNISARTTQKTPFPFYSSAVPRPLYRNGCLFIRLLHSNRSCLQSHSLAAGLYGTVYPLCTVTHKMFRLPFKERPVAGRSGLNLHLKRFGKSLSSVRLGSGPASSQDTESGSDIDNLPSSWLKNTLDNVIDTAGKFEISADSKRPAIANTRNTSSWGAE